MKEFQTKKKFGQNFLTDGNLLNAICMDAGLTKEDEVLEQLVKEFTNEE